MNAQNKWNFDTVIDRINTDSIKWDSAFLKEYFKGEDLLPLWVADMDFQSPQPVIDALVKRAKHGIFGYCAESSEDYLNTVISWFNRRYGWSIEKDWIIYSPGVVPACNYIYQRFSQPGDKIIIQEPVYYPFARGITANGRIVESNQLQLENNYYTINFTELEKQLKDPLSKIFVLCSPHNPVGRVWKKEELKQIGDLCLENEVLVIADEIHCDLIYPGFKHIPFASLSNDFAQNSITTSSGTKTFNLAGLHYSNAIIPNEKLREDFKAQCTINAATIPNVFGGLALQVAYDQCEDWLEALIDYIVENFKYLQDYISDKLPDISIIPPEGTYLAWMDFRDYKLEGKKLQKKLIEAKVALDSGYIFGAGGDGFERINIGCPRETLHEALVRISNAVKDF